MARPLIKPISRLTETINRGRQLLFKAAKEGIYIKGLGERWSSAYLVPWEAVDDLNLITGW